MLREISQVAQRPNEDRRRWFRDDYFDIFTWQNTGGALSAFQVCYDLAGRERALSWRAGGGYSHHRIDSGEGAPQKNMTPIMRPDGAFALSRVVAELDARGIEIDGALLAVLRQKIQSYESRPTADPRLTHG